MPNINQLIDSFDQCLSAKALDLHEFERLNLLFKELHTSFSSAQADKLLLSYSSAKIINANFVQQTLVPFCLKHQDNLGIECQIKFSHFLAEHNIYNKKFCETLVESFLNSTSEVNTQDLIDIQWSLSKHKFYDENFFREWQAKVPEKLSDISNHDLSKSILALAKNNYFSPELVRDYIQECNKRSFNRREAVNIAYGLSILMVVTKSDSDKTIHNSIFRLLESITVSNLSNEIEIRQIISSYHSLDTIQQDSLTAIKSKLEPWESMLRNVSKFTISEPQTAITQYLKKYDPYAQEEAWFFPIATSVDIYLPSIRTFVQVDGKRHFYNNRPDLYLSTTQFNTKMIERYAKLLRLSNFHSKSFHKIITNELNDQFFANQKASYVSYSQESAAAIDTSLPLEGTSNAEIKNKKTKKKKTKQNTEIDDQVSKQSKGKSKASSKKKQEEDWEEVLKEFQEPQQVGDLPLNVEIEQFKVNHDIKKNIPLGKILKLCIEHENFSLATRIFIENPKLIRPEVGLELFEHCIKHENFDLANSIFIKIPNLIEPKKITDFIFRIANKPNLNLEPQYDQLIELVNTAIRFNKLDMQKIFFDPQISAIIPLLIDSDYDFNQTFLTPNFKTGELSRVSIFSRLCFDGDENNINKILRQDRVNCDLDKELFTPCILMAIYNDPDSLTGLNSQYNIVKLLLEHNFSANVYDSSDLTSPLLYCMQSIIHCTQHKTAPLSSERIEHLSKLANLLMDYNASVFITDDQNRSILMFASMSGNLDIVKIILEKGCPYDIDLTAKFSSSPPLCLAINYNNNQIVELLTEHGAKINQCYGYGSDTPPLFFAIEKRNLEAINILLEKGADLNYITPSGISAIDVLLDEDYLIDDNPPNLSAEELLEANLERKKLLKSDTNLNLGSTYNLSVVIESNTIPITNIVKVLFQNGFYNLESFNKYTQYECSSEETEDEIESEIRKYQKNPIKYIVQNNDNYQSKLKALETLSNAPSLGEMQSKQAKRVMHTLKELSRTDNISRAGSMYL